MTAATGNCIPSRVRRAIVQAMVLLPVARHAAAAEPAAALGVLYPDIGEPYRSIFTKIIEGIEQQAKGRVASFAVGTATIGPELATELRRRELRVVIALGRNGLKAAVALEDRADLMSALWSVVIADGLRDAEEDRLMRMVTPLLGLTEVDSAQARQRAERRDAEE